jgi:hypothetical protein
MNARLPALPRRSNHLESIPCDRPSRGNAPANRRKFSPAHPLTVLDLNRTESTPSRTPTPFHPRRLATISRQKRATSAILTPLESHSCTMSRSKPFRITFLRKNRGRGGHYVNHLPEMELRPFRFYRYIVTSLPHCLVASLSSASLLSRPNMERVECRRTSFL